GAVGGDLLDRRLGADADIAAAAGIEQPFVIKRRMQAGGALDDHAAVVIVAGDLLALPAARHHGGAGLRIVVEVLQPLFLGGEMRRGPGADKPPMLLPRSIRSPRPRSAARSTRRRRPRPT